MIMDLPVKWMNDPAQDVLELLEYLDLPEKKYLSIIMHIFR